MPNEASTLRLGEALAAAGAESLRGRVLHLRGELGSGKTTLARGTLRALGHAGRVKSPTYTLVEPYSLSRLHLYHFDFYRFKDGSEWLNSGFREHFNPESLCIVEWPERAGEAIALPDLEIQLAYLGDGRTAELRTRTSAGKDWLVASLQRWHSA